MNYVVPVHLHALEEFPRMSGMIDINYSGTTTSLVDVVEQNVAAISRILPKEAQAVSTWYRNCFWIAGVNLQMGKALAHICPWTFYSQRPEKFWSTFLRLYRWEIIRALKFWRDEGQFTHNNELGIMGSCIFPSGWEKGINGYLDSVKYLADMLGDIFPGEPQVLAEPSLGDNNQHVIVKDSGVHIFRKTPMLRYQPETHLTIKQVTERVRKKLPKK